MIQRKLYQKLLEDAKKYPVVAVTGPRQSGKTTLVRNSFPDLKYISLEDPDMYDFATEDPRKFLDQNVNGKSKGLILDEVQKCPSLLSYLQSTVDEDKLKGQKRTFVLSGSNNIMLAKGISQSLAGRVSILKLLPFSIQELESSLYHTRDVYTLMYKGQYPRIYDEEHNPTQWYQNYLETYFEKDLKELLSVKDLVSFRKMLVLLASSCGQLLNLSSLGNSLGHSHNTIKAWIAALEASYLIFLLQPYHGNFKKRLVKTPKVYFYDTGIVCSLLKIRSSEELKNHYIQGQIFENLVIANEYKKHYASGNNPSLYFWRDHIGNEIDLVREMGAGLDLVEIKSASTIKTNFFKAFDVFSRSGEENVSSTSVVYGGDVTQERTKGIIQPWWA